MIIAKIQVTGVQANVLERISVPAGIVGGKIEFSYDEAWEGLQKTVVITGAVTKDIVNAGDMVTVPAECVAKKMVRLHVGVYGMDDSGTLAIPTLWADLGIICDATDPSGDNSTDESFPVWAQILAAVGDLNQLSTQAKESLVAAVNEIAEKSGGTANPEDIRKIVEEYLKANPPQVTETDPTVPSWAKQPQKPQYTAQEVGAVATEKLPAAINDALAQAKASGEFKGDPGDPGKNYELTDDDRAEIAAIAADLVDVPTKPEDIGAQPAGNYLTEVPDGYATEEFVKNKIAEAELGGEEVDLSGYAQKSELPTKVSQLQNDSGYITEVPVSSVNGKTGAVQLSAADVGARPSTWMPTAQDVGALPSTYTPPNQTAEQVGADPKGTAVTEVSQHNAADDAHGDIRLDLKAINDRLTAFFDSDNQTLDELSEIVAYITSNKALIDAITTSKVSVLDIVDNLTTNVTNKPLSAAQGVVLKGLIDTVSNSLSSYALKSAIPTKVSQLQNDSGYLTQHQDISGKLDASALPTAINTALTQAKASGEFDGKDGNDGVSPTVAVSKSGKVTTVTITDKNGQKTATINDGADGSAGSAGKDGTSVTVKSVNESTADGGSNVVTFSDGKTITIKNGSKGSTGAAGKTPVKGTDYFTTSDKAELVNAVIAALPVYNGEVV